MITLTEDEFHDHSDSYDGYCTNCKEITRFGMTEPDAEKYECPECDRRTCMGIEQALIAGHIDIKEG